MFRVNRWVIPCLLAVALLLLGPPDLPTRPALAGPALAPLGTAFTYQGLLRLGGQPVTATCDLSFGLFAAPSGGSPLATDAAPGTAVSNGLFTVELDFGAAPFAGEQRFLEIAVSCPGGGSATLSPRQPLTPSPYALFAPTAGTAAGFTGALGGDVTGTQAATVVGALRGTPLAATAPTANQVLQFNAGQWGPATLPADAPAWLLAGNAGTDPNTQFLGTTDGQPLNVRVNNVRGWRLEPRGNGTPNVIGGFSGNTVEAGAVGAMIGGGGGSRFGPNSVLANFGTVGGGEENTASGEYATVGGGLNNTASGVFAATVGGGQNNTASGFSATVSGGRVNRATGITATVPGGVDNAASGNFSFAAGRRAKALHQGTFVWADSTEADFASDPGGAVSGNNTFHVRAGGGIRLVVGSQTCTLTAAVANFQCAGASARALKEGFASVEPRAILEGLAGLPVRAWSYLTDGGTVRHLGPTAEDFQATFGLGDSDQLINSLDAQGVAFAAIQGLYQVVQEQAGRIAGLAEENRALGEANAARQARIAELERQVAEQAERQQGLEARLAALETTLAAGVGR